MGNRLFCLAGVAVMAVLQPVATLAQDCAVTSNVVVALIDTGINPYNVAFRDPSPTGQEYPGLYIPGYPAGVPALRLSLDAPSYDEALKRDDAVWKAVKPGKHQVTFVVGRQRFNYSVEIKSGGDTRLIRITELPFQFDLFANVRFQISCRTGGSPVRQLERSWDLLELSQAGILF